MEVRIDEFNNENYLKEFAIDMVTKAVVLLKESIDKVYFRYIKSDYYDNLYVSAKLFILDIRNELHKSKMRG